MTSTLQPRAVLVTGASSGIGRATALDLARRGYRVFAGVRRDADAESLRAAAPSGIECVLLDVTEAESRARARAQLEAAVGDNGLHGLVNNAGVSLSGPIEAVDLDVMRNQFEVNVIAVVAMIQTFTPLLRKARGRIVNVSSMGGFVSAPFHGPYCATKFALEAITDSLRHELRPFQMEVSLIQPGSVDTQIWAKGTEFSRQVIEQFSPETRALYGEAATRSLRAAHSTAARAVSPDVVAALIAHALSAKRPKTRYVAGADARLVKVLRWMLPDRALDYCVQLALRADSRSASPQQIAPVAKS